MENLRIKINILEVEGLYYSNFIFFSILKFSPKKKKNIQRKQEIQITKDIDVITYLSLRFRLNWITRKKQINLFSYKVNVYFSS